MINLDPWQKEILDYEGNIVLCTGRQNGKTTIFSIKCAEEMRKKPGTNIIVASLTEDQAKLIIIMTADYLEKNALDEIDFSPNRKPTQNRICLKNGSEILARPVGNTGDALRGFTGDILLLDEVARMPDLAIEAGKPTLFSTGGKIWMCSTPKGKKGFFYESFLNEQKRFKVWHIDSERVAEERAISESWTEKQRTEALQFLEFEKKSKSKTYYGQEYLALFLDDLQQLWPEQLITKVTTGKRPDVPIKKDNFMGVDIARLGGDSITYEIIRRTAEKCYHVESIVKKEQTTDITENEIISLAQIWNCEKVGIDAGSGSLGVGLYDRFMIHPMMKYKVIAMNNREIAMDREGKKNQRIFKEDMYENFTNMMEKGEIVLLDDDAVRHSMRSVQMEYDKDTGKLRIFGNDTHIVEGLVRACWLAKKEKVNKLWISYI